MINQELKEKGDVHIYKRNEIKSFGFAINNIIILKTKKNEINKSLEYLLHIILSRQKLPNFSRSFQFFIERIFKNNFGSHIKI